MQLSTFPQLWTVLYLILAGLFLLGTVVLAAHFNLHEFRHIFLVKW